jgi:N-acetylmuramoyl-L-alanine amidase
MGPGNLENFTKIKRSGKRWLWMFFAGFLAIVFAGHPAWAKLDSSASSQKRYAIAKKEYQNLLYSKSKMKYRKYWVQAIAGFQSVLKKYPKTQESYKSVFTLGRLYQKLGQRTGRTADTNKALSYYHRLEAEFPAGWLTDDALYYAGKLYVGRKSFAEARVAFQKILTHYPKGDFVPKAQQQLKSKVLQVKQKTAVRQPAIILRDLTFISGAKETRVVLKVEGSVKYSKKRLRNPDRVYFDFQNARWGEHIPDNITVEDGRVEQLRMTDAKGTPSRLVLDLDEQVKQKVTVRVSKNQLIIVVPHHKEKFVAVKAKSPKKKPTLRVAKNSTISKVQANRKTPVVVLDAGHGGKDYGAKGAHGIFEKDLNLQISKQVKTILQSRYHYKVIMTRKNDTFIELKDRGKIANQHNADLFVSIHANAAKRKSAKGIETYYLGSGSNEQALETAERENGDLVHSVADDAVQEILASLISNMKINDSSRLAAVVQKRLHKTMSKKFSGIQNLGVKEGPFFVLHDTNMPSILVEVGFVTNRQEGQHLKSKVYQKWLADSIARGIHDYLKEKAPSI